MNFSPHAIANEVRMKRTQFSGAFLLTEGPTDARFYKFFVSDLCRVINAHTKEIALTALAILESERFPGVLAIVDTDYWRADRVALASDNIVVTDGHDLETMIIQSPALDRVLAEFGSEEKISAYFAARGLGVREAIAHSALPLGYLRWLSVREKLSLDFEGVRFGSFVQRRDLAVDVRRMVAAVASRSGRQDLGVEYLLAKLTELEGLGNDPWDVCCGHDLVEVLSIGLRQLFGTRDIKDIFPEVLTSHLRMAFEGSYFRRTRLWQLIARWEQSNSPYEVLPSTSD
jgi:hypothetical protein